MLDTIRLKSPPLLTGQMAYIWNQCNTTKQCNNQTGEVVWELTTGQLEGSYDHRLSVRIEESEVVAKRDENGERLKGAHKVACPPYLVVEGSVHKAILGHNLQGGPLEPASACRYLVAQLAKRVGHWLPAADRWEIARIDWAEVYDLGSYAAVEEYISGLSLAPFPRRKKVQRWGNHSVHAPSDLVTLRVYAKGKEFSDHDYKRLKKCEDFGQEATTKLQETANNLLRIETQLNARKLRNDFRVLPLVSEISRPYLEAVHDQETARLLREGQDTMETVRTLREVSKRLREHYTDRQARALLATWQLLAMLGEAEVKRDMNRTTFYEHRKLLQDVAVSWHATDVQLVPHQSWLPVGFAPIRSDPRRLSVEAPEVVEALFPYKAA